MTTGWTWLPDGASSAYVMTPAAKIDGAEMAEFGDRTGNDQARAIDGFHDLVYSPDDRRFRVERFGDRGTVLSDQSHATAESALEAFDNGEMTWEK